MSLLAPDDARAPALLWFLSRGGGEREGNQEFGAEEEIWTPVRGFAASGCERQRLCNGGIFCHAHTDQLDKAFTGERVETLNRQPARALYEQLTGALETFIKQVHRTCTGVIVYPLPIVEDGAEVPEHIPVERLGHVDQVLPEALELATAAYAQFSRLDGQKHTTAFRLPGCVIVSEDLSESLRQVNALKDQLQSHLKLAYPDTVTRSRTCHQLFPGVHMNHVYRHLQSVPPDSSRLNFTWQCQTPADVWITREKAMELIVKPLEEQSQIADTDQLSARQMALRIAQQHIQSLPKAAPVTLASMSGNQVPHMPYQLLRRSIVRPHPRVQIFAPPAGSRAIATHAANLPLLVMGVEPLPRVRDLGDYQAKAGRRRTDSKTGFEKLCSAPHLYGGIPSPEQYLRRLRLQEQSNARRIRSH